MSEEQVRPKRRVRNAGKHPRRFHEKYKELNPEKYPETVAKVLASGKTPAGSHRSILAPEILEALAPRAGEVAVGATLGFGGHAEAVLRQVQRLDGVRLGVNPVTLIKALPNFAAG